MTAQEQRVIDAARKVAEADWFGPLEEGERTYLQKLMQALQEELRVLDAGAKPSPGEADWPGYEC